MMRGLMLSVFCGLFCLVSFANAQEASVKLKDGSVLKGTILSRQGNLVRIRSGTMGDVWISKDDIASLEETAVPVAGSPLVHGTASAPAPATYTPASPGSGPTSEQFKAYQEKIMGNPQTMESVQALAQNKDIQDILSDPGLRDAIARNDMAYLQNNPKFQKFLSNPEVQKIVDKVTADDQGAQHAR